jgi:outer membrane lipoprotein-sorting protein
MQTILRLSLALAVAASVLLTACAAPAGTNAASGSPTAGAKAEPTRAAQPTAPSQSTTSPQSTGSPQATMAPQSTVSPQSTTAPQSTAMPQATTSPQSTVAPQPTMAPESTKPAMTAAPATSPTASGGASATVDDLIAKAKENAEFSASVKTTFTSTTPVAQAQPTASASPRTPAIGVPSSYTGKMMVKGNSMRVEEQLQGQNVVILFDGKAKVMYLLTEAAGQKVAMKVDLNDPVLADQVKNMPDSPGDIGQFLAMNAKLVGVDTVDGKSCTVYESVSKDSITQKDSVAKFWIWNEKGITLRQEVTNEAGKIVSEFSDFRFEPQSDSLFQLPSGHQVMDLASLMGGVAKPTAPAQAPTALPTAKP